GDGGGGRCARDRLGRRGRGSAPGGGLRPRRRGGARRGAPPRGAREGGGGGGGGVERPGLTPGIVQDAGTNRVLMLAWMDEEALRRTRDSGEAWFWSRSRQTYWRKGGTSGNTPPVGEARA